MELKPVLNRLFSLFGNGTAALIGKLLELVEQRGFNDPANPGLGRGHTRSVARVSTGCRHRVLERWNKDQADQR